MARHIRTVLLGVLTLCAVAVTVATVRFLRWQPTALAGVVLDTWTAELCSVEACQPLGHRVSPPQ